MTSCYDYDYDYDYEDAIENFEALMDEAWIAGYVKIRQRAGREFMLRLWELRSPLEEFEEMLQEEAEEACLDLEGTQMLQIGYRAMDGEAA